MRRLPHPGLGKSETRQDVWHAPTRANPLLHGQDRPTLRPMRPSDLLHPRPEGLYCPPGDFFIDPVRPVARALITHGHSDHARSGHRSVLATRQTLDIMALRY